MKVLIVTPSYFPIIGGSETLVRALSTKLNESGIHTDIMAFNMNKKWKPIWSERIEQNDLFRVFKVPALNPFPFAFTGPLYYPLRINVLPRLDFRKKLEDYDIIHFLGEADLSLPFFSISIQKPKIMHCVGVPGLCEQFRRHPMMKKFFMSIFRNLANLYIVFSPEEQSVLADLGITMDRTVSWTYGVDTDVFRPDESKKLDNLILFVGRIHRVKGLHVLLKSLHLLRVKTRVVIIGPVLERGYFEHIKRMILAVNKEGFHTVEHLGNLDHTDLIPWYQRATVLVRPDVIGASGAGISTIEALACGTPVIGVKNHVVRDRINGRIIRPNDPAILAKSLKEVLEENELAMKYGKEGRRTVEEEFNLRTALSRLVKIYKYMLNC